MFSTVPMSRMTLAAPVDAMADIVRACSDLGCVHIEDYTQFEEGIGVGRAIQSDDADKISALLLKVRAVRSNVSVFNAKGASSASAAKTMVDTFESEVDKALSYIEAIREAETEIASLEDQVRVFEKLAPLNISLDLLTGYSGVEVYVAETANSSKAAKVFADLKNDVEFLAPAGLVAVACAPNKAAEVQMALAELNAKVIQLPSGEGKPAERASDARKSIENAQSAMESNQKKLDKWATEHGSDLVIAEEYLQREDAIFTSPTSLAVSNQAFALDAWVPTENESKARSKLKSMVSHLEIEEHVDDHHHGGHDDHHAEPEPPIAYQNGSAAEPFELVVDLVGRPKYGTFEPTTMIMITLPLLYGLILGDFGYGFVIVLLALWLRSLPFAKEPMGKNATTVLLWMGIWCMIWGFLFAEGFGFIWDESWSPLEGFYAWTKDLTYGFKSSGIGKALGLGHTYVPFHRADSALTDYVLLSVYIGALHLLIGYIIGFFNVLKGHGIVAAFFEKGSWMMILCGGFLHIYGFMKGKNELLVGTIPAYVLIAGVLLLIVALAVFEGFGWAGGVIMGPIETFGLLANTLSYLRIMAVGVAGVKIAEISNDMGFASMRDAITAGDYALVPVFFLLWIGIQVFAIALGLLSPTIHAARLHFVEWMGKFYDGSGRAFSPLGGQPLHVEGKA
ncbi:MAG TPA: V-type ATP synthase subunit I [Candidatus Poseidoniales archaeon]|nr:MAG TPA: V-type ATP synthase subunit I [Candidatus Poseidoniales archaeon]HII32710.1 V-type ATP synthase subunit I [Candidatus Poseidoniaceae archaeon]